MGHAAIATIESEHRSLAAVLHGLLYFVQRMRDGHGAPDYKVLRAMLYYIDLFPDRYHHPKEDRYLFAALRRRTHEAGGILNQLQAEHAEGEDKIRRLMQAVIRLELGGRAQLDEFAAQMEAYAQFHWKHMELEEDVILPLAEKVLTDEDWREIDAAFAGNADPLVGIKAKKDFDALFTRIVTLTPPPIGVGPEIDEEAKVT